MQMFWNLTAIASLFAIIFILTREWSPGPLRLVWRKSFESSSHPTRRWS